MNGEGNHLLPEGLVVNDSSHKDHQQSLGKEDEQSDNGKGDVPTSVTLDTPIKKPNLRIVILIRQYSQMTLQKV